MSVMDNNDDDDILQEYGDGLEYEVVPRPQELIDQQRQFSSSKSEPNVFGSTIGSKSSDGKHSTKTKEKKVSKHERKGLLRGRLLNEDSLKKASADERSRKHEALKVLRRQLAGVEAIFKKSTSKQKLESSKVPAGAPVKKSESPKIPEEDYDSNVPLAKAMTEPAETPLQRFRVLDARDADLRAKIQKEGESKKVKIIGTCPDMCPEKERYGRIAKKCVNVLEMARTFDQGAASPDTDHFYMIKEYSRSSADQQEPLPHELRPLSVLKLTMEYLICNFMDKPPENVSLEDWYDFIWNRTRSIRKDITQQELCDPQCVEIIEKCVRFHIHCAEALSEEDTAVFDPRINNENLTKCLQTLKHMYYDLQSKGIQCPNEAEFRSYDILLSLTEGETLRLVKDIRKDLLKSRAIKSAFEAALAYNSHNFVKFFNLIEKADYLSSCILHRYINKVRSNSLHIIIRAYSTAQGTSVYSTVGLIREMKFENSAEAIEFCRCHGLDANEHIITIDRKQFTKSSSRLPLYRSSLLVGRKKGEHLSMIINKGALPLNPKYIYQPHDSFDENGLLMFRSLTKVSGKDDEMQKEMDEKLEQAKEGRQSMFEIIKQKYETLEEENEEMETDDIMPVHAVSFQNEDFNKSSFTKPSIKESNIEELKGRLDTEPSVEEPNLQELERWKSHTKPSIMEPNRQELERWKSHIKPSITEPNLQELQRLKSRSKPPIIEPNLQELERRRSHTKPSIMEPNLQELERRSHTKSPVKEPNLEDLEKRRSRLLARLSEVVSADAERLKQKKERLKHMEKIRSSKKSQLPERPHKSIMFSDDNSSSAPEAAQLGVQNSFKEKLVFGKGFHHPAVRKNLEEEVPYPKGFCQAPKQNVTEDRHMFPKNFGQSVSNSGISDRVQLSTDSFFKFNSFSSAKALTPVCFSNSNQQDVSSNVFASVPSVPSALVSSQNNMGFGQPTTFTSSFQFPEPPKTFNFGLTTSSTSFPKPLFANNSNTVADSGWKLQTNQLPSNLFVVPDHLKAVDSFIENSSNQPVASDLTNEVESFNEKSSHYSPVQSPPSSALEQNIPDPKFGFSIATEKTDYVEVSETETQKMRISISHEQTDDGFYDSDSCGGEPFKEIENEVPDADSQDSKQLDEFVHKVAEEIINEYVEEYSPSICEEVLNEERVLQEQLKDEIAMFEKQLAIKVIFRWRIFVQRRCEKRMYEKNKFFSPWQAMLLNTPYITSGAVSPVVAYKKHCSLSKTTADKIKKCKEVAPGWKVFNAEEIWPLEVFKLHSYSVNSPYFEKSGIVNFHKVCLVLPPADDSALALFLDWICAKFALKGNQSAKFDYKNVFMLHSGRTVVSVRAMQLVPDLFENSASFLNGVTSMILFAPSKDLDSFFQTFTTLRDSSVLDFPFPLFVYCMRSNEIPSVVESYVKDKIDDLSFTAANIQCMQDIHNFNENSNKLSQGLAWFNKIEEKAQPLPTLKKLSFRHYVEEAFSYIFNVLLCKASFDEYKFLLQDPQRIINFYNKIMIFRASVLCDDFLERVYLSWPPEEIRHLLGKTFIDMQIQNLCKTEMEKLLLPDFEGDPSTDICAWEYARRVPSSSSNIILSIKVTERHVDWIQKIIYCAEHLYQNSDFLNANGDVTVYYMDGEVSNFDCDQYWLNVVAEVLPQTDSVKRKNNFEFGFSKKQRVGPEQDFNHSNPHEIDTQYPFENSNRDCVSLSNYNLPVGSERKTFAKQQENSLNSDAGEDLSWLDMKVTTPVQDRISELKIKLKKHDELIKKSSCIEDIRSSIYNGPAHSEVNCSADQSMFSKSEELNKDSSYVEDVNISNYNVPVGSERKSIAEQEKFTNSNANDELSQFGIKIKNFSSSIEDRLSELKSAVKQQSYVEDCLSRLLRSSSRV